MNLPFNPALETARADAASLPLDRIDPGNPERFRQGTQLPYFARLRAEDPVHYTPASQYGPYWSITKFDDIMAVDTNHKQFSSEAVLGGITIGGIGGPEALPMFIAMDPPKHDVQRKAVTPIVAPPNLRALEPLIRQRAGEILDGLPIGEEFDWVDKVSMELTAMTLANLFDFPQEDRRKLTHWSDITGHLVAHGGIPDVPERDYWIGELQNCFGAFGALWEERYNAETPGNDLVSMLAHGPETRDMDMREFHGNVLLLIVGGNDTTRNTISGSIYALNKFPDQYDKLRANHALIPSMVSETIRWQTPLAHMRRTAVEDVEFRGKHIKKGDKVIMWYVSGNRDEGAIENPDAYVIDRARPRQHISFGFGIHRCVGNRLAELQLQVIWEEILKRFPRIEMVREPKRVYSSFVQGYEELIVRIPERL